MVRWPSVATLLLAMGVATPAWAGEAGNAKQVTTIIFGLVFFFAGVFCRTFYWEGDEEATPMSTRVGKIVFIAFGFTIVALAIAFP